MFSKNLRYYRLKNHLSKKALADKVNISPMSVTNYENGSRKPNMETMRALAAVLGVRVSDFLAVRNEKLVIAHGEFRKNATLNQNEQDYIRESVEEYFNRFMTAVEILGGDVLPDAPQCHALKMSEDDEVNAESLRIHLGFATSGPIEDLVGKLENKGILALGLEVENQKFSGMNGFVNDRPFLVFNSKITPERNRSTIGHELAHLMFVWPDNMDEQAVEEKATAISGAFLLPKADAIRELGVKRSGITGDMLLTAREYGVSMFLLATRARGCGIVTAQAAKEFFVLASQHGWRTKEPSRIAKEEPSLFKQLVLRAVSEDEISISRAAELLKTTYENVQEQCSISLTLSGSYAKL